MSENALPGQRITIVGSGLIGLCSAHYLVGRGAQVTVVDRAGVGSGAARGNGGLIAGTNPVPLPAPGIVSDALRHLFSPTSAFFVRPGAVAGMAPFLLRFAMRSTRRHFDEALARLDLLSLHSAELWDSLHQAGLGSSYSTNGQLRCFDTEASAETDHAAYLKLTKRGFGEMPGELLDADQLRRLEPCVGPAIRTGYLVANEAFANPSEFVDQMHDSLVERGVKFVENCDVRDVGEGTDGAWVETASGRMASDQVLISAGARSGPLAAKFGVRLWLKPGKGYSFSVPVEQSPTRVVYFNDAHCAATPLGARARIAGTMEFDGTFDRLDNRRVEALKRVAHDHLKGADWSDIADVWVGPRPMTLDGAPAIGPISPRGRVTVATGHNMIGFALAPATGSLVADLMSGQFGQRAAELKAFQPTRFQFRSRKAPLA
jgi:D-amino-acid dehydrogenase